MATSELGPLAKTGGLADVSSALALYFQTAGHDVRVLMPYYSTLAKDAAVIEPVESLQNLTLRAGPWELDYAIDRAALKSNGLVVYLLRCPALYDRGSLYTSGADEHLRFVALCRAAIEMCQHDGFAPDIFHCHDWHTALIPLYLKTLYAWDRLFASTQSVLTLHNIGYQGMFPAEILPDLDLGDAQQQLHQDDLRAGVINFLKTGLLFADLLTTVSPTYAHEVQHSDLGMGLQDVLRGRGDSLIGILNGIDADEWNPETDTLIPKTYSAKDLSGKAACKLSLMREVGLDIEPKRPLIGIVSRLASQKGVDLMERVLTGLLRRHDFALTVLGSGEPSYERFFTSLQSTFKGRVSFYRGYNNRLAHWIEAGSDMFLMPSVYEPCGLNQMYSLKYGTVPIVRETGGLADTVEPVDPNRGTGTGILFRDYDETGLRWAIETALSYFDDAELWSKIVSNGMRKEYSWDHQGALYVEAFQKLINIDGSS